MKLLFIHDAEKLKEDQSGSYYTDGAYSSEVWDRYFAISNELRVIFRKDNKCYSTDYAKSNFNLMPQKIKFIEVLDRNSSIKSFFDFKKICHNNKVVENEVKQCDGLIVRLPCDNGYSAIKYAIKYKKMYLVEVVGCVWDSLWNHSYKGKAIAFFHYLKMRKVLKKSKYCIYVSKHFLQKRYPCNGFTTNCSNVTLPNFESSVLSNRIAKIYNYNQNSTIILGTAAAVDVRYKGQQYVIKAISYLNRLGHNYEYHIAGNGDCTYLKLIAQKYGVVDKVKFIGSIPHSDIFDWFDNIDIYIQPSITEGLPRALVEAMSRGCPSLGTCAGGITELLNSKFLFKKRSIKEISKILLSFDKETMIMQAKLNFDEAKRYNRDNIDERRKHFFIDFHREVINVTERSI